MDYPELKRNDLMELAELAGVAPNTIHHFEAAFLRFSDLLAKKLDSDRAQRAAPGVQVTPEQLTKMYDDATAIFYGEACSCAMDAVEWYAASLRVLLDATAQPPQQSAHPVAEVVAISYLGKNSPPGKLIQALVADLEPGEKLYRSAQSVEVQRVPLTPARKNAMRVEYVAAQPEDAARAYYSFIAGIEWAEREHGIKPTSSEGGAAC